MIRHDSNGHAGPSAMQGPASGDPAVSAAALRRAAPLLVPGVAGVTSGGLVAAGVAHAPTPAAVWLAAYLVLVVGVAQIALALGQALLASPAAGSAWIRLESLLFNVGSAGVIAGALGAGLAIVVLGTVVFLGALVAFLLAVHGRGGGYAVQAYRALIGVLAVSAAVGLLLAASGA